MQETGVAGPPEVAIYEQMDSPDLFWHPSLKRSNEAAGSGAAPLQSGGTSALG